MLIWTHPIGRLLMLSDGEYLTNLDCELETWKYTPGTHLDFEERIYRFLKSAGRFNALF